MIPGLAPTPPQASATVDTRGRGGTVDAPDLGSGERELVEVQVLSPAAAHQARLPRGAGLSATAAVQVAEDQERRPRYARGRGVHRVPARRSGQEPGRGRGGAGEGP